MDNRYHETKDPPIFTSSLRELEMPDKDPSLKTILVVDDEESVRKLVVASLRKNHYRVFQAEDGKEALELAVTEHPDLIVMDVYLVEESMNGLVTATAIKEKLGDHPCKFLFISGRQNVLDHHPELAELRYYFITKPFSPLELRKTIESLLDS
ncbi:Response regulator [Sulfidibacter corallicola]|uniref:Response regulator n=1 Tax=Sulfidibacter corallicola TaxID=2818388 RepID=A0A8A4TX47_SULCO|nr:response regulator [Sulfidibacter corallicola]QTD53694.1 response regulator [Sulfidibacter corallicola]